MRTRVTALVVGLAVAVAAVVLVASGGPSGPRTRRAATAGTASATPASSPAAGRASARADCSGRSEADFPGAFTSPRNLVVGPLVLIGGAYTPASTVREVGGQKFPLLVKGGHTVTVRLAGHGRRVAGLAYGPLPEGETKLRDTYGSVTFVACRPGRPSPHHRAGGPSRSSADGVQVTFWSGFVLTRAPACVPLDIYVDGASSPRRVGLALGRRCGP
jgi:hypothetical protein